MQILIYIYIYIITYIYIYIPICLHWHSTSQHTAPPHVAVRGCGRGVRGVRGVHATMAGRWAEVAPGTSTSWRKWMSLAWWCFMVVLWCFMVVLWWCFMGKIGSWKTPKKMEVLVGNCPSSPINEGIFQCHVWLDYRKVLLPITRTSPINYIIKK